MGKHTDQPRRRVRSDAQPEKSRHGTLSRRAWVGIALGGAAAALAGERWWRASNPRVVADATPITVYASPSCTCCHRWVPHLEDQGFLVTVEKVVDVTPIKRKLGVPPALWSCHTAMVATLAVEGHVPADLIHRALREHPRVAGLAAPGMPSGSPGMEGATKNTYEVVAFTVDGESEVYAVR